MHGTWNEFLNIVHEEIGSRVVETWFKSIKFERWDSIEKIAYLVAPNAFVKDWVQKHYMQLLQMHLGRLLHVDMPRVSIEAGTRNPTETKKTNAAPILVIPASVAQTKNSIVRANKPRYGHINKNYSFENFVIGPSNSLAYAAAYAITEQPGNRYNPLFIYGKSGLGKTHLLHAIGNEIKNRYPDAIILYQPADRFVSEFINAIRFNKVHTFQRKYHTIDVLLIDDLQFISHKEHTQEAFFHIFNALYESHKQIVFSSDLFPHDIEGIADRLRSRLACGLITDIYMPSLETKIAILKKKAASNSEVIDDEIAHFIASQVTSSIRELEGALIRVLAFATLTKQAITIDLAKRVLNRAQYTKQKKMIDFNQIMTGIYKFYPYSYEVLCSKSRNKELAQARQVAMFLMKKLTDKSLRDIGSFLGGRDHTTIMHGLQKVEYVLHKDVKLQEKIKSIEKVIHTI